MTDIWSKNYQELEAAGRGGFYSAQVREHNWPDHFVFRAYPHHGSCCTEFIRTNRDELVKLADR